MVRIYDLGDSENMGHLILGSPIFGNPDLAHRIHKQG